MIVLALLTIALAAFAVGFWLRGLVNNLPTVFQFTLRSNAAWDCLGAHEVVISEITGVQDAEEALEIARELAEQTGYTLIEGPRRVASD